MQLSSRIEIEARADEVWSVLTDFRSYSEWNPSIFTSEGEARVGARLTNQMRKEGGGSITLRPRVLVADPRRELRWLGHLFVPGIFDGDHRFLIEEVGAGRVRLTQAEKLSGVLVPFMPGVRKSTTAGFVAMNSALKERTEARARQREKAG
jgi:hypothetical protein